MAKARVISLRARAKRSAELSFPMPGVIEVGGAAGELGFQTTAFDARASLYPRLGDVVPDADKKKIGRLVFDSERLRSELLPKALFVLNNESLAADLDQAILTRQNEYLLRYRFSRELAQELEVSSKGKLNNLNALSTLVDAHYREIENAYATEAARHSNTPPSVDNPQSVEDPPHGPTLRPTTVTTVKLAGLVATREFHWMKPTTHGGDIYDDGHQRTDSVARVAYKADANQAEWADYTTREPTLISQQATSIAQSEQITHPRLENDIRHKRLSADLLDEILAAAALARPGSQDWQSVLENELRAIDLSIRKLQLAYIDTFLLPPVSGRVSAVYKQVGENVRAAESIVRIDDTTKLLLIGQVICAAAIAVGQKAKVETRGTFGDKNSPATDFDGKVVMVRGGVGEPGKWNVVFEVEDKNATKIPVEYDFEPDPQFTTITIS